MWKGIKFFYMPKRGMVVVVGNVAPTARFTVFCMLVSNAGSEAIGWGIDEEEPILIAIEEDEPCLASVVGGAGTGASAGANVGIF